MVELNPNHPVTAGLHDNWHKLLLLVLFKYRDVLPKDVVIVREDLDKLLAEFEGRGMPTIFAHDRSDGLHLRVIDEEEGVRLAHESRATN